MIYSRDREGQYSNWVQYLGLWGIFVAYVSNKTFIIGCLFSDRYLQLSSVCETVANLMKPPNFIDISLKYWWVLLEIRTEAPIVTALAYHGIYKYIEREKVFKVRAFFWCKNWEFFYCLMCYFAKEFLFFVGNIYTQYNSSPYNQDNKGDHQ